MALPLAPLPESALATLAGHEDYVQCIALSPNGRLLAAGLGDGTIKFWDVASRQETGILRSLQGDNNSEVKPESSKWRTGADAARTVAPDAEPCSWTQICC